MLKGKEIMEEHLESAAANIIDMILLGHYQSLSWLLSIAVFPA